MLYLSYSETCPTCKSFSFVNAARLADPDENSSCAFLQIMCGLMSMATIYEYNKLLFVFCLCRNDGSHCVTALSKAHQKNLVARIRVVLEPRKTGGVSCGGGKEEKKEQMLERPPSSMTNMQTHTQRKRSFKNGHVSCLFPTRRARREGIFSGCG